MLTAVRRPLCFLIWFRQRAAVRARSTFGALAAAGGICADFARHRRAAAGFCVVLFMWEAPRILRLMRNVKRVSATMVGLFWDEVVAMLFVLAFIARSGGRGGWRHCPLRCLTRSNHLPSVGLTRILLAVWALWRTI